jgi:uncharacterized peroxidase-related enzyme
MTAKDSPTALDLPQVDPLPPQTQKPTSTSARRSSASCPTCSAPMPSTSPSSTAFTALYNDLMLAPSGLSKLEREMIAVTVSSINRCYYCQVAHGAAVRELSGNPMLGEQLVMNWRIAEVTPASAPCWSSRRR